MFKKILWATDGSETADRALPFAKELAAGEGHALIVFHADEHFVGGRASGSSVLADEGDLETKIRAQVEQARSEGLEASFELAGGSALHTGHTIAEAATKFGADVIVVGSRGHSAVAGLLVGSVTQRLLHVADCPVLAVPPARG
jgi:nucleotide-binding universal stress UspA family protein